MPQPLSSFTRKSTNIRWAENIFDKRPDCAIEVAKSIATASRIDFEMSMMLGRILKTQTSAAHAIYTKLETQRLRKVAISAVAQSELSEFDFEVFSAVFGAVEAALKQRHMLAHGVWGESESIKDGVLLVQLDKFRRFLEPLEHIHRLQFSGNMLDAAKKVKEFDNFDLAYSDIYVYKITDFKRINRDLGEAYLILKRYRAYLDYESATFYHQLMAYGPFQNEVMRASILNELSSLRLFREARRRFQTPGSSTL